MYLSNWVFCMHRLNLSLSACLDCVPLPVCFHSNTCLTVPRCLSVGVQCCGDTPTSFSCRPWFFLQPDYWRPRRSTAPNVRQHTSQRRRASSTNPEEGLVNGDAGETLDPDVAAEAARVGTILNSCGCIVGLLHTTAPVHMLLGLV